MHMEVVFSRLIARISALESMVQRQQVRLNNIFREGQVKSVDPKTGLAIVDAHGVVSKPSPWLQQAGSINEWTPLSEKQRVVLVSPSGDLGRSFIIPGGFTDETPSPHDQLAEKRVKIGGAAWTQSASGMIIEVDGTKFEFTAAGFRQTGGGQWHDEKNVGSTHTHGGIFPGGSDTLGPNP